MAPLIVPAPIYSAAQTAEGESVIKLTLTGTEENTNLVAISKGGIYLPLGRGCPRLDSIVPVRNNNRTGCRVFRRQRYFVPFKFDPRGVRSKERRGAGVLL